MKPETLPAPPLFSSELSSVLEAVCCGLVESRLERTDIEPASDPDDDDVIGGEQAGERSVLGGGDRESILSMPLSTSISTSRLRKGEVASDSGNGTDGRLNRAKWLVVESSASTEALLLRFLHRGVGFRGRGGEKVGLDSDSVSGTLVVCSGFC
jgi:hypothetical protein